MIDAVAKLQADLSLLDSRIQAERNDEVRHALQRGRLEAERSQLLVKLITACGAPVTAEATAYAISYTATADAPPEPAERQKRKPEGLPTLADMVLNALRGGPSEGTRPRDIAAIVRRTWPDVGSTQVSTTVWQLAKKGRLQTDNGRYRLPKPNGAAEHPHAAHAI